MTINVRKKRSQSFADPRFGLKSAMVCRRYPRKIFSADLIRVALLTFCLGFLLLAPPASYAQTGEEETPSTPVPVDQLPPLNLPDMPGESRQNREVEERPDIPPPPPPLPLPTGPAKIKADIAPSGTRAFKLFYDGTLIGWSEFRVAGAMKLGETDALIINSVGELHLGFGKVMPSRFEAKLMIDRNTLRPAYFKCEQEAGGGSFEVECVYSETMVAQTNRTGDHRSVHFHNFEGLPPQLVFNNLWGHIDTFPEHYWLMVRSAVNGGFVPSYDPILKGEGDVIVYPPKEEDFEYGGRTLRTKVYPISDLKGGLLARVRVASDSFEVLEVDEVGSGLKMIKTEPGIGARLKNIEGLDLSSSRVVESNVVFPDPEQLTALEAEVDIRLRGGPLADHRIAGYRQYFTGELREGVMKGRVFVRSVPREVPYDAPFPLKDLPEEEMEPHLSAGPGVELDYPPISTKAREITWKSPSAFEAARRLNGFVHDIEEGVSLPSARYALESGVGNPESKALLLLSMARSVKLPSRKISGIAFREGNFVPHHWVEIWLGGQVGWSPFDPTTGEAGRVGASHIALLDSGEVQELSIRVTDFAPRATKRVPFIARELQWSIGEKRTYGVYKDGEKIGTEVARVGDIEILDGEEVYVFTARSEVQGAAGAEIAVARQLLTPQGLPRRLVLEYLDPISSKATTYLFGEDTVLIRPGKEGDEEFEETPGREYPFAKGTYFTDPRLLTQWALMAGQVPLDATAEKDYSLTSFLPDRQRTREMNLEVGEIEDVILEPRLGLPEIDESEDPDEEAEDEALDEASPENQNEKADLSTEEVELSTEDVEEAEASEPEESESPSEGFEGPMPFDPLKAPGSPNSSKVVRATHLFTDTGVEFWLNERGQVVKIEIPEQGLELILERVETSLD